MTLPRRVTRVLASVVATGLLLAGCSGSNDDGAAGADAEIEIGALY